MAVAPASPVMRPNDVDAYRKALRLISRQTGAPVAFGGQWVGQHLLIDAFVGVRTDSLRDLLIVPGRGLGGYVLARQRPKSVSDYETAEDITHDYDEQVLGEGIRTLVGVPVFSGTRVRGVLYAAVRSISPLGDRGLRPVIDVARGLGAELALRDEVDRRLELIAAAASVPIGDCGLTRDDLRDLRSEVQGVIDALADDQLRLRLRRVCDRLDAAGSSRPRTDVRAAKQDVRLSRRELEVLEAVALGCSNAEVGRRLSLKPETVKAYLSNASHKLGAHGRYQAVLAARRRGLLS